MLYLLGLALLLANTDVNDKMKTVIKRWLLKTLWRYNQAALVRKLRAQGIAQGDTLVVHASWKNDNGFSGSAKDFIDALKMLVGNDGLLIMMSMPYQNQSTRDYLAQGKVFNVNRTPSMMGLLSEVFRRGQGVVRSVNAAHPLLAWGHDADRTRTAARPARRGPAPKPLSRRPRAPDHGRTLHLPVARLHTAARDFVRRADLVCGVVGLLQPAGPPLR